MASWGLLQASKQLPVRACTRSTRASSNVHAVFRRSSFSGSFILHHWLVHLCDTCVPLSTCTYLCTFQLSATLLCMT